MLRKIIPEEKDLLGKQMYCLYLPHEVNSKEKNSKYLCRYASNWGGEKLGYIIAQK